MTLNAWLAVAVVLGCFAGLAWGRLQPYLVLLAGLTALLLAGVLDAGRAFAGFGNPGVVTIGALFVVVAGLRQTGVLARLASGVLGRPADEGRARLRLLAERSEVPVQAFVMRADLACGSTIGPITATETGIPTTDLGLPTLAMHSIRELACAADIPQLVSLLLAFYRRVA